MSLFGPPGGHRYNSSARKLNIVVLGAANTGSCDGGTLSDSLDVTQWNNDKQASLESLQSLAATLGCTVLCVDPAYPKTAHVGDVWFESAMFADSRVNHAVNEEFLLRSGYNIIVDFSGYAHFSNLKPGDDAAAQYEGFYMHCTCSWRNGFPTMSVLFAVHKRLQFPNTLREVHVNSIIIQMGTLPEHVRTCLLTFNRGFLYDHRQLLTPVLDCPRGMWPELRELLSRELAPLLTPADVREMAPFLAAAPNSSWFLLPRATRLRVEEQVTGLREAVNLVGMNSGAYAGQF